MFIDHGGVRGPNTGYKVKEVLLSLAGSARDLPRLVLAGRWSYVPNTKVQNDDGQPQGTAGSSSDVNSYLEGMDDE